MKHNIAEVTRMEDPSIDSSKENSTKIEVNQIQVLPGDKTISEDCEPPSKKSRPNTGFATVHSSPKKRLNISSPKKPNIDKDKPVYTFGNYSRYYGYRNTKDYHDVRLDVFARHKELFADKEILDIGCNVGLVTMAIAREYSVKHITGMDIDKSLINQAKKFIQRKRKNYSSPDKLGFPFNIAFVQGNYVVRDSVLLEVPERYTFDLILCLSVTKWIHLNFGDAGLKLAFKRMYRQLKPGGKLILEPQPWSSYKRRKRLTPGIESNYKNISFLPKDFTVFLLSTEVGFNEMYELEQTSHDVKGFQRPLQVFVKQL